MSNRAIRAYVRTAAETAEIVASVCSGALILASVGLLEGREATTHWAVASILESYGATYRRARWVEDGKFILSAGVSAGIDMGLQLAARLTDGATARQIQSSLDSAAALWSARLRCHGAVPAFAARHRIAWDAAVDRWPEAAYQATPVGTSRRSIERIN
jgi:putative intracellular protease/amidase